MLVKPRPQDLRDRARPLRSERLLDRSRRTVELKASAVTNFQLDDHREVRLDGRISALQAKRLKTCLNRGEVVTGALQREAGVSVPRPRTGCRGPDDQVKLVVRTHNRWYYHAESLVNIANGNVREWVHGFLGRGLLWTGNCDSTVHRSQRLDTMCLKSSDWPTNLVGPSWPSFPSIVEWMEMLRKGVDPLERPELKQPGGQLGFTQLSRSEINGNIALATLVVRQQIVGVRSTVEVPRKFLKYFRYRWNFLILVCNYQIPAGLVRFLLAQWVVSPYSLWLRRAVNFKTFLKKVPTALVKRGRAKLSSYNSELSTTEPGYSPNPTDTESEYYSGGESELD